MLMELREIYARGENISTYLKNRHYKGDHPEAIKVSYDLQAGSYIKSFEDDGAVGVFIKKMVPLIAPIFNKHLDIGDQCLDFGTGEMTMLTSLFNKTNVELGNIFACDISWSRIRHGLNFLNENKKFTPEIHPLVCNGILMPFATSCIDVVMTTHALEPNRDDLATILKELFRVTKKKCIFVEPSYECASEKVKRRMDNFGYIKDLEKTIGELGAKVVEKYNFSEVDPNNPSVCYVVTPPNDTKKYSNNAASYTVPGTDFGLSKKDGYYFSEDLGVAFPCLLDIPIFEEKAAILATSLIKEENE